MVLEESPRPITRTDCGVYFDEFEGMLVAFAHCYRCEAKYLAWIDGTKRKKSFPSHYPFMYPHPNAGMAQDLSFRSTFNDEPGPNDLPKYKIVVKYEREPWSDS